MNDDTRTALLAAVDEVAEGNLNAAHSVAQQFEGDPVADSLHAIIHRRDGDYSNSKYWWCRVGDRISPLLAAVYDGGPAATVDLTGSVTGNKPEWLITQEANEIVALKAILAGP